MPRNGRPASAPGGAADNRPAARHGTHGFETVAIHAGNTPDPMTGAVVPAIYQV
ncbi:hypothetical protein ACWEP3_26730, partial [Streptomyces albidoflavus]